MCSLLEIDKALKKYNTKCEVYEKSVFIYGAGNAGGLTYNKLKELNADHNVKAFLDKNASKINNTKFGLDVINPEDEKLSTEIKKESIVFISVFCNRTEYENIKKYLLEIGYGTIYYYFGLIFLEKINELENDTVKKAFGLLKDNESREIYLKWIEASGTICDDFFEEKDEEIQYFVNNVKFEKGYSRFIDCGAYIGDTAKEIVENKGKIDAIACFEADIENYSKLVNSMRKNRVADEQILLPCAVWSKEDILRFNTVNSGSSCISDEGSEVITAVSIDQCLSDFAPTFIKMDIEGAEEEALKGARETIKKYKPDMAISIYHKLEHIWKLMIYIDSIAKGYEFYMRCHHFSGMETVLYATYSNK